MMTVWRERETEGREREGERGREGGREGGRERGREGERERGREGERERGREGEREREREREGEMEREGGRGDHNGQSEQCKYGHTETGQQCDISLHHHLWVLLERWSTCTTLHLHPHQTTV